MAASDDHNAGVVLWNQIDDAVQVAAGIHHLPFSRGAVELYRIDSSHASFVDSPSSEDLTALTTTGMNGDSAAWEGTIPAHSVVFLRLRDQTGQSLLARRRVGIYVRSLYDFPDRTADSYTDFDPQTSIARLGSGSRDQGLAQIGVVLDHPSSRIQVQVREDGPFRRIDDNSTFGVRVDYPNRYGDYYASVFLYGGSLYSSHRTGKIYWGTGRAVSSHTHSIPEMATGQPFIVDIDQMAPNQWNLRRVILTFVMQNVGAGSRARFILSPSK